MTKYEALAGRVQLSEDLFGEAEQMLRWWWEGDDTERTTEQSDRLIDNAVKLFRCADALRSRAPLGIKETGQ